MDRAETAEQRWNRIQADVQGSILTDYPNPERKECPGMAKLRTLAQRAAMFDGFVNDAGWQHVTHCSPCYKDFLEARDALRHAQGKPSAHHKK